MNKNVIYIVGATVLVGGAFLFLKNKKKKDLLKLAEADKLAGTTPSATTSGGTTTGGTTAQNNEVFLPSDKDMKLIDATLLVGKIKDLKAKLKIPFTGRKFTDSISTDENRPSDWTREYTYYKDAQTLIPQQIEKLLSDLDDLDYSLDAIDNLVKLDPNRNKEWIKVQKLYLSLVNIDPMYYIWKQKEITELAKYGYKIDPTTKKLVKI